MSKVLNILDTISKLLWSVIGAMILSYSILWFINLYELFSPTDYWFDYKEVKSVSWSYMKGQPISMVSTVGRRKDMELRREDTAYCYNELDPDFTFKWITQFRPVEGTQQVQAFDFRKTVRKYYPKIDEGVTSCKICGSAIWITKQWYKKVHSYCSNLFLVNK